MNYHITHSSRNSKVGNIAVTTSNCATCPDSCPFKNNGCYASSGPLAIHWKAVSEGNRGTDFKQFVKELKALPEGSKIRYNQAGDLPGKGDTLNINQFNQVVSALKDKKGWTYTHKPLNRDIEKRAIKRSNEVGFTVNLSANNLKHADELADLEIAPVVTVIESDSKGDTFYTPKGRKVIVCPQQNKDLTCESCMLCQKSNRSVIVAFKSHGTGKKKVDNICAVA